MVKDRSRFYQPELDCLRFVAFLGVLIYHFNQNNLVETASRGKQIFLCIVKSGVFGVDLFFCLSSFLITILLLREYDLRGSIDVRAFWIRRVLRIWPLYYFFLLLSATVLPYWLHQQQLWGWQLLRYCIFLGNYDCIILGWQHSAAAPLWSISVEEQFYVVWPLLLLAVKPNRIVPLAVAALIGANLYRLMHHQAGFVPQWVNTLYHVDPIAWGAIGAYFAHTNRLKLSMLSRSALLLTGALVIPAYFYVVGFVSFFDGKDLVPYPISALCCAFIVVSLYNLKAVPWDSKFMKIWGYLGRISYGLYVFHLLALSIVFLQPYGHGGYQGNTIAMFIFLKLAVFAATLGLTILFASASYAFLESPFLKLKKKYTYIPSSPQGGMNDAKQQNAGGA